MTSRWDAGRPVWNRKRLSNSDKIQGPTSCELLIVQSDAKSWHLICCPPTKHTCERFQWQLSCWTQPHSYSLLAANPPGKVCWITNGCGEAVRALQIGCRLRVSAMALHHWGQVTCSSFIPLVFNAGLLWANHTPFSDLNARVNTAGVSDPGECPHQHLASS